MTNPAHVEKGVRRILADGEAKKRYFFAAALFGALAVVCEMPSVLIALLLCAALLRRYPAKTCLISIPAGLAVAAAFFGSNYFVHGTVRSAYSHKRDHIALAKAEGGAVNGHYYVRSFDPGDWYIYRYFPGGVPREAKNARMSFWSDRQGVDKGEPSRLRYALNALAGHHGLFSLTPVWLLSLAGLLIWLFRTPCGGDPFPDTRLFAAAVLFTALCFFAFYVSRPQGSQSPPWHACPSASPSGKSLLTAPYAFQIPDLDIQLSGRPSGLHTRNSRTECLLPRHPTPSVALPTGGYGTCRRQAPTRNRVSSILIPRAPEFAP